MALQTFPDHSILLSAVLFRSTCLLLIVISSSTCDAYQFNVGGRDGWVTKPSEDYDHWAQRLRFQVNDTLFFKYEKGSESVLLVNKDDYDNCRTDKPIEKMDDGNSVFKFNRSGPFYFISSNGDNCQKGQKLVVVVLAVRNKSNNHYPPLVPAPAAPPKGLTPSPAPAPAALPKGPTPSPASAPAAPPKGLTPSSAPSPAAPPEGPTPSQAPAPAAPPEGSTASPAPAALSPSDTPAATQQPPSTADVQSPPGNSNAAALAVSEFTPSAMLVSTVVLSLGLAGFFNTPTF